VLLAGGGCAAEPDDGYLHHWIRHDGMRPTYALGEGVVSVDEFAYAAAAPRVGDIVLFRAPRGWKTRTCAAPTEPGRPCTRSARPGPHRLLSRVIAKPGDTVAFQGGAAVVNGKLETRDEPITRRDCQWCNLPAEATVPPNHVFLAGDNRPRARDSRSFGPIPYSSVIGKALGFTAD
jgi:signal peptidase I